MICNDKYVYRIELITNSDVYEFNRIATAMPGKVTIVNGKHRLNAKSFLGVHLARVTWNEMYVETEEDSYCDFRQFIVTEPARA